jgi:hypothetical protein
MWILFARAPLPDRPYWTGRRALAVLDALLWPVLAAMLLAQVPGAPGVMKPVLGAVTLLAALHRLHVAWFRNHRYGFTTWWLARALVVLLLVGVVLKVALAT